MPSRMIALLLLVFSLTAAGEKPDAVTSASGPPDTTSILPPAGSSYEVIGWVPGIQNFVVKYNDTLFRGGQLVHEKGAATLKEHGIKTIISITVDSLERALVKKHGFKLVELKFDKKGVPADQLKKFMKAVKTGKGPFYLHCHGGKHRAGVLAAAYRMRMQKWSYEKAAMEFGQLGGSLMVDHKLLESIK